MSHTHSIFSKRSLAFPHSSAFPPNHEPTNMLLTQSINVQCPRQASQHISPSTTTTSCCGWGLLHCRALPLQVAAGQGHYCTTQPSEDNADTRIYTTRSCYKGMQVDYHHSGTWHEIICHGIKHTTTNNSCHSWLGSAPTFILALSKQKKGLKPLACRNLVAPCTISLISSMNSALVFDLAACAAWFSTAGQEVEGVEERFTQKGKTQEHTDGGAAKWSSIHRPTGSRSGVDSAQLAALEVVLGADRVHC